MGPGVPVRRVLTQGTNCMGIFPVEESGLLIDSRDYYRAFFETAQKARRYLLLAGWQFDSEVKLVRGEDQGDEFRDVRLLPFLESLLRKEPELNIYILAWDFSMIFSLEREWFQDIIFNWTTNERLRFRLDNKHPAGATHHQKFVIADGSIAFVGGMDICSDRWDDRRHLEENPERTNSDGTPYGAYHDIQTYHAGAVVAELVAIFRQRWRDAGGGELNLPAVSNPIRVHDRNRIPLPSTGVAVSRTWTPHPSIDAHPIREIRRLFIDAILGAERLIYMENQYFSSQLVYDTLMERMNDPVLPPVQIILILPDRLPFTEELFLGMPQIRMLRSLQKVAEQRGHRFAPFSTVCIKEGERKMTFIHSKLLLVDDRFLTVGSANATNRSMALDSELNVSWEAEPADRELAEAIRQVRVSLLAEHLGWLPGVEERLEKIEGLADRLSHLADGGETRLCRYMPEPIIENGRLRDALEPVSRVVDPEKPLDSEFMFEYLTERETGLFAKGILLLSHFIAGM
jgi:phospholipase D1/2